MMNVDVENFPFLRGKAAKQRRARNVASRRATGTGPVAASGATTPAGLTPPSASSPASASGIASSSSIQHDPTSTGEPWHEKNVTRIKLFSPGDLGGIRYNIMKMNQEHKVDPRDITAPILMNRKPRGGQDRPIIAYDAEGTPVGKFVYDNAGKPVLGASGEHVVEIASGPDLSLVGGLDVKKKHKKATVRETYAGDAEAYRMRREEADPWVLESGNAEADRRDAAKVKAETAAKVEGGVKFEADRKPDMAKPPMPERWVGMMQEQQQTKTVLIVDNGQDGFNVLPLGRTYLFNPKRPFEVPDVETAHKRVRTDRQESGPELTPV